jgi:inosine-uridine nucleoside N-ribohydrolase
MAPVRLWVDTDVGDDPDDVVALLCAAALDVVDLVGVSTVPGVPLVQPALAAAIVDAPVHSGEDPRALVAGFRDAAPEALLAIGPLANVAALLDAGVDLPPSTVMGGVLEPVHHRGVRLDAEHNFATQPAAAARVVAATDATLVTLDTTLRTRVSPADLERLTRAVPLLAREVAAWFARRRAQGVPEDALALFLHDPLALLVAVAAVDVRRRTLPLTVDPASGVVRVDDDGRAHDVITEVDGARVVARVVDAICP